MVSRHEIVPLARPATALERFAYGDPPLGRALPTPQMHPDPRHARHQNRNGFTVPSSTVDLMSDETAQRLKEATAIEVDRRADANDRKWECLKAVARGIPARVEEIAKRVAQGQPEVAKELGSDGIKDLRGELADRAAVIASEVEEAAEQIEWPSPQSEFSMVEPRSVQAALYKFLYGPRVESLAAILKRHGFSILDDNVQRSQDLIRPQYLYDEGDFTAVAEALNSLAMAERAVATARAAEDHDIIDSLWGDE